MIARRARGVAHTAADAVRAATHDLLLVSDGAGWALDQVAHAIAEGVPRERRATVITRLPTWVRGKTIHFVNRYAALEPDVAARLRGRDRVILTWSHGGAEEVVMEDLRRAIERMPEAARGADLVQVWTSLYVPIVEGLGIPRERIVVLPLGIDTRGFPPATATRAEAKRRLGLDPGRTWVGSFQRDGEDTPKHVKGPDLLVELTERLERRIGGLGVLLTGPARGWVRAELARRGIAFRYFGVVPDAGRAAYYHACDLYAITSREEGGPISLLEAMSSGTPVVSTRVGMAVDAVVDGVNGALADVEDIDALERAAIGLLEDEATSLKMIAAGVRTARQYDWRELIPRYDAMLYSW
ncbi:MAG: glycosyltransferase family 4 protein [Elusimicrobia bacterium]|nr:glycosyltransferase family 4 protein [Elusimicrobiota bacterium]